MIPSVVRLYNPQGSDRVALVSTEPAFGESEGFLVRVARGASLDKLTSGTSYGPYPEDQLLARFDEVVAALTSEGYVESGLQDLLLALDHADSAVRARAALSLGWRQSPEAVPVLVAKMDSAVDDLCSILDALGAIGDPRAIEPVRKQAARKLLSRRRSAVEALRGLDDTVGLAEVKQQTLARLPEAVQASLGTNDNNPQALIEALTAGDEQRLGLYLDSLYELDSPTVGEAVRAVLNDSEFPTPYLWRYVKSILKRSMLRHDPVMFGWLAHRIERQARSVKGTSAKLKSGYDGVERNTTIFSRVTQNYVRRSTWRYLRQLAKWRPDRFAVTAANALVHYSVEDTSVPKGKQGQFASCYLLHQILFGSSTRFTLDDRRLSFRFTDSMQVKPPEGVREEAYPELWDAQPKAYLRLLSAAALPDVHEFAHRALKRSHPDLLQQATADELAGMLSAPHPTTTQLALAELQLRFDPALPDWSILDRLVADDREEVMRLAHDWLKQTARLWSQSVDRIEMYLQVPVGKTQALVVELVTAHVKDATVRTNLAKRLLERLRDPAAEDLESIARVARTILIAELGELVTINELLEMITGDSAPAQSVAAEILGNRADALRELGLPRTAALAEHQVFSVRAAAHRMLHSAESQLREDPSLLFLLVESRWEDTRGTAMQMLRLVVDWSQVDLSIVMGLLDSNQVDVQNFAIENVRAHFEQFDSAELAYRMVQHPHRNMRQFAFELVQTHLPDGVDALTKVENFFRAGLFDTWPQQKIKHGIVDFLTQRGLRDLRQAEFATFILNEFVRVNCQGDFEQALQSLARLQIAFPDLVTPVSVNQEALV